ncbi:MAG: 3-methyl-2-oxobutanoate hydroxymethyltransferase [candidate division Zixibacteria bacterium RBG_16_50_21]|nr:MAG: 3-methyl-2-oxobutanoate hydroxymethyltransferase [candidate division Zixibacteria bacterium RBG_16_50_21]
MKDRVTTKAFLGFKQRKEKIAVLTAYDFYTARILDEIGIDCILVGDSANMVFYGYPNTLSIPMEVMLYHTKAVANAVKRALVVGDMPFLSYQPSVETAICNAGRFLKEGNAQAVKLEGGLELAQTARKVIEAGIPVMGHIGLVPQSIHKFGSYSVQGKTPEKETYLIDSALALQEAGCFSIVLEAVPMELAKRISQNLQIPTVGIGAGPECDGQVLVINDILGLFEEFKPKFVRQYAKLSDQIRLAAKSYLEEVKKGKFPGPEESF